jgi:2-polyprenyl-6-methoxyphenol hydroxylase-like FAD-dependent oxidoreductase
LWGDAAHPMLPFMGQGAAQSIEDGLVLARCFAADRDDPERAIDAYTTRRRARTARLQAASRDAGRNLQLSDPADVAARNEQMLNNPDAQIAKFDPVWGYDAASATPDS